MLTFSLSTVETRERLVQHILTWSENHLCVVLYLSFCVSSFHFYPDKQNELELPCPVPKSRDRKRRQGQQQGGMMTQISGVRKVSHTPSISGGSGNRFGVKTDQEELLSKVCHVMSLNGRQHTRKDMKRFLITSSALSKDLENINKWGLNIFRVAEHSHNRPLTCIMYSIFQVSSTALYFPPALIESEYVHKQSVKTSPYSLSSVSSVTFSCR